MPKKARQRPTREQTAARLLDSAAQVFCERGFAGASIEEICSGADLTRGAFYSSFGTKEELFLALFDRFAASAAERLTHGLAALEDQPSESYAQAMALFTERGQYSRETYLLFQEFELHAIRNPEIGAKLAERHRASRDAMVALLKAHAKRKKLTVTVPLDKLMRAMSALHASSFAQHLIEPKTVGPSELYDTFVPTLLRSAFKSKNAAPSRKEEAAS